MSHSQKYKTKCEFPNCENVRGTCAPPNKRRLFKNLYGPYGSNKASAWSREERERRYRAWVNDLTPERACQLVRNQGLHFGRKVDSNTCKRLQNVEIVRGAQMHRWKRLSEMLEKAYPGLAWLTSVTQIKDFNPMLAAISKVFFENSRRVKVIEVKILHEPITDAIAFTYGIDAKVYFQKPYTDLLLEYMHTHRDPATNRVEWRHDAYPVHLFIVIANGIPLTNMSPLMAIAMNLVHEIVHIIHFHCKERTDDDHHSDQFVRLLNLFAGGGSDPRQEVNYKVWYDTHVFDLDEIPDNQDTGPRRRMETYEATGTTLKDKFPDRNNLQHALYNEYVTSVQKGDNYFDIRVSHTKSKINVVIKTGRTTGSDYKLSVYVNRKSVYESVVQGNRARSYTNAAIDYLHALMPEFSRALAKEMRRRRPDFRTTRTRPYETAELSKMDEVETMRMAGYPYPTLDNDSEEYKGRVQSRKQMYRSILTKEEEGFDRLTVEVLANRTVCAFEDARTANGRDFFSVKVVDRAGGQRQRPDKIYKVPRIGIHDFITKVLNRVYKIRPSATFYLYKDILAARNHISKRRVASKLLEITDKAGKQMDEIEIRLRGTKAEINVHWGNTKDTARFRVIVRDHVGTSSPREFQSERIARKSAIDKALDTVDSDELYQIFQACNAYIRLMGHEDDEDDLLYYS